MDEGGGEDHPRASRLRKTLVSATGRQTPTELVRRIASREPVLSRVAAATSRQTPPCPGAFPRSGAAISAESAPSSVVDPRPLHASRPWCARRTASTRCTGLMKGLFRLTK